MNSIIDKFKSRLTKHNITEFILVSVLILIVVYFVYSDFKKERKPTACEINSSSEDCYIETKNNEYNAEDDYQPGAYGPE